MDQMIEERYFAKKEATETPICTHGEEDNTSKIMEENRAKHMAKKPRENEFENQNTKEIAKEKSKADGFTTNKV